MTNSIVFVDGLNVAPYYELGDWFMYYIRENFIDLSVNSRTLVYFKTKDITYRLNFKLTTSFKPYFTLKMNSLTISSVWVEEDDYDGCAEKFVALLIEFKKRVKACQL
jgi:hypothetical protein